jgi:hypothetical protein
MVIRLYGWHKLPRYSREGGNLVFPCHRCTGIIPVSDVIPAKAGIQYPHQSHSRETEYQVAIRHLLMIFWIPAFAGMTG